MRASCVRVCAILLAAATACGGAGQARIAGHVIPPPPGFKLENPPTDFVCFDPRVDLAPLALSFCARPLVRKGVLAANSFGITAYPLFDHDVQVRGFASDGSKVPDTVYFILETDDLILIAECAGSVTGSDLVAACERHEPEYNDWARAVLGQK